MSNIVRRTPPALAPAQSLREITLNCNVEATLASDDPRWQDFSAARGDHAVEALKRELEWRPKEGFVHTAFFSHRGAGKSTELRRLTARLEHAYCTVFLEATIEMDPFRIEAEDLLLNLVMAVEARMREIGKPLDPNLLKRVAQWFSEAVSTTTWAENFSGEAAAGGEIKASVPFLGSLFASAKGLFKQESAYRTEVKQILKKYPGTLLQSVNEVLDAANKALGDRALLVVIDNLDRYTPDVIDRLLVEGADRVRQLRCNLILTPPISLMLQPQSAQLNTLYSCHILYAVRLRKPNQRYDEFDGPGRDLMEQALRLRIDVDRMFSDKAALNLLISSSGGAIRELLDLVTQAAFLARGDVIAVEDVERAIAKSKQSLRDLINANGWMGALRRLGAEKQIFPDPKCLLVLFHRLAFKYNGEGWYDVHPLVADLPEFKDASSDTG
jgi:hypothetical protein